MFTDEYILVFSIRNIYYCIVRIWSRVRQWEKNHLASFIYNVTISLHDKVKLNLSWDVYLSIQTLLLYSHFSGLCFSVPPAPEGQIYIPNIINNGDKHLFKDVISDVCFKSVRKPSDTTIKHWLDYSFPYSFFPNYLFGSASLPRLASLLKQLRGYLISKYSFRSSGISIWAWEF